MTEQEKYLDLLRTQVIVREWDVEDIQSNSVVSVPANETCFSFFGHEKHNSHNCETCKNKNHKVFFSIENEEKRIIQGLVMKSGQWIPRLDADGEGNQGYIYFSRDTIRKMQQIFFSNRMTFNHSDDISGDLILLDSYLLEYFASTEWHCKYQVLTDRLWNYIKEKRVVGFSIEAFFTPKKLDMMKSDFKSIDSSNIHEVTSDELQDVYKWVLGTSDHCSECKKWARKPENTLDWWCRNALPGVQIGTQITEEISAGSSRFQIGEYNTFCTDHCHCHLLLIKKAKKKK